MNLTNVYEKAILEAKHIIENQDKEIERLNSIIKELNKELIDITRFKNNILDDLEKRTLEVNKLRDKLKLKRGGKMKQELKQFDIDLDKIEENSELFDNIHEAIEKMKLYTLSDKFEVVLNNNLIESKEKLTNYRTIMGCRISYDNLDRNISFIVREDKKPSYEKLENQLQQKENIIKEVRKYCIEVIKEHENGEYNVSTTQLAIEEHKKNIQNVLEILDKEKHND